jgi:nucleotide-binding universal stress UspA family protein
MARRGNLGRPSRRRCAAVAAVPAASPGPSAWRPRTPGPVRLPPTPASLDEGRISAAGRRAVRWTVTRRRRSAETPVPSSPEWTGRTRRGTLPSGLPISPRSGVCRCGWCTSCPVPLMTDRTRRCRHGWGSRRSREDESVLAEEGAHLLDTELDLVAAAHPELPVERILAEDTALRALMHRASSARMLVVGYRGRHEVGGMMPGSTSSGLVEFAPCPVVVAKPDSVDDAGRAARTSGASRLRHC